MRTEWLCKQLDQLNIGYYHHPHMNIVTIKSKYIPDDFAEKFDLVPDTHDENHKWYKVVIMDHVEMEHLEILVDAIKQAQKV